MDSMRITERKNMHRLLKAYKERRKQQLSVEKHEEEIRSINALYAQVFKTQSGQKVLDHMVSTQMARPIAERGDDMLSVGEKQGRSNVVNEIIQRIEFNS